ncbi:2-oxoglutarate-dependent dioxygenase 19 [Aegilops tauschii subsp. strangulata]|uniref:Fe2OG dioxygenase domain-containing protein n=2 Tax=Aegilops tauschii subsp. strangulata TaxID=200361 RepID=A0A453D963_AEGTS|nr:2-oxoglutarate-dependent dioxygenase 19 [Aegilops tauschii subsp. strangulata]
MAASNGGALPVVDLAPFFAVGDADDAGARARATEAVREACQATGFFRAVNHGVPHELMARALDLSAAFFALPDEEKAKVRPAEGASASPLPVGYARQPAHSADKNEYLLLFNPKLGLNHYPAEPAGFRDALEECYAKLTDLGLLIQDILSECMGLPPGFLAEYNADRGFDFLTALRYFPATSSDENNGISAHEDGNCITFVLQDGVGGLEVLGEDGRWVPAEPVEGSIVVNVGDVLQVLSNKKFKSATHRVVRRPGAHRHSIAFFLNLHGDKWVEPLPEFAAHAGEPPRYRGFRYNEYMQLRMRNKTHPPTRPEDVVHITHYDI